MSAELPPPPDTYQRFVARFPKLGEAWGLLAEGGQEGSLSERERRLVKLALAIGAAREGAVHSAARKAPAGGISRAELEQVVALAASTIGLPATVAAWTWVQDV